MAVLATLSATAVILAGPYPRLDASLQVAGDTDYSVDATLEVSSVAELARPRLTRQQIVAPFKVTIGGAELPYDRRLPGMSVRESLDGGLSFSFSVPRRGNDPDTFLEPLGSPASVFGVNSKAEVDIDARLIDEQGVHEIRLVTAGLLENTSSSTSREGDTRQYNGLGAKARQERRLVTWTVSPGHGLLRENVVRRLLEQAGVPANRNGFGNSGRPLYKGIQLVDRPVVAVCDELLKPSLKKVHENRRGQLVPIDLQPRPGQPIAWTFDTQDVLDGMGGLTDGAASDGPTCVTFKGTKQILREDDGHRTEIQVLEVWSNVPPAHASFRQSVGSSTLTPITPPTSPADKLWLRSRTIFEREYAGDTLISEHTVVASLKNPLSARYKYATDGSIGEYTACFILSPGAVADDGEHGYLWEVEQLVPTQEQWVLPAYDARGFLVGRVTTTNAWTIRKEAVKGPRSLAQAWTDLDYLTTTYALANDDGIADVISGFQGCEVFQGNPELGSGLYASDATDARRPCKRETTAYQVTDDGFVEREETTTEEWAERPGGEYLYNGGQESSDEQSVFIETLKNVTAYIGDPRGVEATKKLTTTTDLLSGIVTFVPEEIDGYLPAADRSFDLVDPEWAARFGDDELRYAAAASRHEQQAIKATVCAPVLLSFRDEHEEKATDSWAEDTSELQSLAAWTLAKGAAIERRFPLPLNPYVRVGDLVFLNLPQLGIAEEVWVTDVEHKEEPNGGSTVVAGERWLL